VNQQVGFEPGSSGPPSNQEPFMG